MKIFVLLMRSDDIWKIYIYLNKYSCHKFWDIYVHTDSLIIKILIYPLLFMSGVCSECISIRSCGNAMSIVTHMINSFNT